MPVSAVLKARLTAVSEPLRTPQDEDRHDIVSERYERRSTIITRFPDFVSSSLMETASAQQSIALKNFDPLQEAHYPVNPSWLMIRFYGYRLMFFPVRTATLKNDSCFMKSCPPLKARICGLGIAIFVYETFFFPLMQSKPISLCVNMEIYPTPSSGKKRQRELSGYYLADELSTIYPGMMIVVSDDTWLIFRRFNEDELVHFLKKLANNVDMWRFKKSTRGPKKPPPKRKVDPKHPHVSTARILAKRKK